MPFADLRDIGPGRRHRDDEVAYNSALADARRDLAALRSIANRGAPPERSYDAVESGNEAVERSGNDSPSGGDERTHAGRKKRLKVPTIRNTSARNRSPMVTLIPISLDLHVGITGEDQVSLDTVDRPGEGRLGKITSGLTAEQAAVLKAAGVAPSGLIQQVSYSPSKAPSGLIVVNATYQKPNLRSLTHKIIVEREAGAVRGVSGRKETDPEEVVPELTEAVEVDPGRHPLH